MHFGIWQAPVAINDGQTLTISRLVLVRKVWRGSRKPSRVRDLRCLAAVAIAIGIGNGTALGSKESGQVTKCSIRRLGLREQLVDRRISFLVFLQHLYADRGVSAKFDVEGGIAHLRDSKLEIFLGYMLSPLSQGIHARFRADTSNLSARTLAHLFRERPEVNSAL